VDWILDNPWVIWLAIAVVLTIVEIFSLELVLLMFAIGALAAALVAGLGGAVWLAILVFAVVSVALLTLIRPSLVEKLHRGPTLAQGHQAQVGRRAVVVEPVNHLNGRIRLSGELWSARTDSESASFDTDTEVDVLRIDGATAVVGVSTHSSNPIKES
jgi:membrane protein implicated in regulation of membrane protease activity